MKQKTNKKKKGFTFIEALTFLFIFSVISIAFYNVLISGTRYILLAKNRLSALSLANEKMEIVRNLKYEDVGTIDGIVEGNIPQMEIVEENGRSYEISTSVRYEDDPYDGTISSNPRDIAFKDYKTVTIKVFWNKSEEDEGRVDLVSRFVSPNLETTASGEGILSINVISDQGEVGPVSQSKVEITNEDTNLKELLETNNEGNITLVGAKESIQRYKIRATKSGYETVETYPAYPDSPFKPVDVHASVIEGNLNKFDLIQNKTANLRILVKDYRNEPAPGVGYKLQGGRKIGTDAQYSTIYIYSLDVSEQTDSNGEKNYSSISPGQYSFLLDPTEESLEIIGLNEQSPFSLVSDSYKELEVKIGRLDFASVLFAVTNSNGIPLEGIKVNLKNEAISYEREIETDRGGLAFFPDPEGNELAVGEYQVKIQEEGYQNFEEVFEISTGLMTEKEIKLDAI